MVKMETEPIISSTALPASESSTFNFRKLWFANGFSNLADGLYQITLPLIIVQLTDSPTRVAGLSIMLSLPWLVFALQAGSIVDRFDRRQVMVWVTGGRMLILLGLTLAVMMDQVSLPLLYIVAFALGIGETLVDTALTSIVPSIIPNDRLNWANAQITAMQTVTNTFIGPPLAGFLAGVGLGIATGSSAVLYLSAAFALYLIQGAFIPGSQEDTSLKPEFWTHLTGGLHFLWDNRLIRDLTLFTASMNIFWAGWSALLVLYAVKPGAMGLNEFEYGLLLTAMAVGGLLGSMTVEKLQKRIGTRNALVFDFIGTIMLVGIPALTTNVWWVGLSAFMAGFGASVWVVIVASIRQMTIPGKLLGRVYSSSRFISWGIGPIGAALAGFIAEWLGIRTMFAISGLLSVIVLFVFLRAVPSRLLESFDRSA